jgi:uncharacterized protein (TIGR02145 family)
MPLIAILGVFFFSSCTNVSSPNIQPEAIYGAPLDYEGEIYQTVVIGSQTWMAQNLNYAVEGSVCYDGDPAYCTTYGRLYNWNAAKSVCPSGWHLPSDMDWEKLTIYIDSNGGCRGCAGKYLKSIYGWNSGNGKDTYGFAALPGGFVGSGSYFYGVGNYGYWWSSSNYSDIGGVLPAHWYMSYDEDFHWYSDDNSYLYSVRCVKD